MENVKQAVKLLGDKTWGRYDVMSLSGPARAESRAELMAVLQGVRKVPKAKASVNVLRDELYRLVGAEGDCEAIRCRDFAERCRSLVA